LGLAIRPGTVPRHRGRRLRPPMLGVCAPCESTDAHAEGPEEPVAFGTRVAATSSRVQRERPIPTRPRSRRNTPERRPVEYSLWLASRYAAPRPRIGALINAGVDLRRGLIAALVLTATFWTVSYLATSAVSARAASVAESQGLFEQTCGAVQNDQPHHCQGRGDAAETDCRATSPTVVPPHSGPGGASDGRRRRRS
jgi:hypothetical protein